MNFKKILFFVVLCILWGISVVHAREVRPMNDSWRFILDDNSIYGQPEFDDSSWRLLNLPHDWSIEGKYDKSNPSGPMGGYMPCGTGWYRKDFTVTSADKGKRFFIQFDGVYMKSQVWINGRMVGEYPNGYNSFEYDITPFVRFDKENVLAVRVDNSLQPASRWYNGSGIYRKVNLLVTDQLHFINDATFVTTPEVNKDKARIHVDYNVICHNFPETIFTWTDNTSFYVWTLNENNPDANKQQVTTANNRVQKECVLTSVLYDMDGNEVGCTETKHRIGDFSETALAHDLLLEQPNLWSPATPCLYKLVSTIGYEGKIVDRIETTVGVRIFEFSAEKGMLLNGEPLKVQGVCVHQNVGCFGSAVPVGVWKDRLIRLKEMGCNAVRTHYPLIPEFQYLCDTLGIMVSKEIFDEWNRGQEWGYSESSYGKLAYTYHLYFEQWAETDQRRMIRRDRNHPSVFLYQLGNELPNQRINGIDIARKLKAITRDEDPTRPTTAACDFFVGANVYGFMDQFDIAGYNYIDRVHKDSLYAAEHVRYPKRVLLGTETYHLTRNHVSIRDNVSAIGEFVWVGFDYLGEIVWPDYRGWSAGILDIAGFPKPEYYLRKSYWSTEPVVHITVEQSKGRDFLWDPRDVADHWNWAAKGKELLPVYVYSNCDEVELFIGNRSLGRKIVGRNEYYARWDVVFKPGKVRAVGYKNGKKVTEHHLQTSGKPFALNISKVFDGGDVIRVEAEVVDKNGVRVPCNEDMIYVESNLKVMGLDNGNQYDPEGVKYTSVKTGRMSNGQMVIYLQPVAGKSLKLTLGGEGLVPAELSL